MSVPKKSMFRSRLVTALALASLLLLTASTRQSHAETGKDGKAKTAETPAQPEKYDESKLPARVKQLMELSDRPTPDQVFEILGGIPPENPFLAYGDIKVTPQPGAVEWVRNSMPKLIAYIERAFPGAVYAPLGRDVAVLGDAVGAFYYAIGQHGRVAPLRGSGGTVRGGSTQQLARFVESAGFNFEDPLHNPPMLLIDETGYDGRLTAQTGYVLRAAYLHYKAMGGDVRDLVRRLNVVPVSQSKTPLDGDVEAYFRREEAHVAASSIRLSETNWEKDGVPTTGLSIPNTIGLSQSVIKYAQSTEWHNGYGALTELPDGRYQGLPSQGLVQRRLQSMADLYAMYEVVSRPEYLAKVQAEANQLGYEFKLEAGFRPAPIDPTVRFERMEARIDKMIKGMEDGDDVEKKYYSPNAQQISEWMKLSQGSGFNLEEKNRVVLMSLWYALEARTLHKVGNKDIRRLLAEALESADTSDARFMEHLKNMIHENPRLARILGSKAWSFSAEATHNHEIVSKVFAVIQDQILVPMGCDLVLKKPETAETPAPAADKPAA